MVISEDCHLVLLNGHHLTPIDHLVSIVCCHVALSEDLVISEGHCIAPIKSCHLASTAGLVITEVLHLDPIEDLVSSEGHLASITGLDPMKVIWPPQSVHH